MRGTCWGWHSAFWGWHIAIPYLLLKKIEIYLLLLYVYTCDGNSTFKVYLVNSYHREFISRMVNEFSHMMNEFSRTVNGNEKRDYSAFFFTPREKLVPNKFYFKLLRDKKIEMRNFRKSYFFDRRMIGSHSRCVHIVIHEYAP